MTDIKADIEIDTRGLQCPRPLLKAKQTLESMQSGQVLKVTASDSTTKSTFPAYISRSGDELLKIDDSGEDIYFYIRKK